MTASLHLPPHLPCPQCGFKLQRVQRTEEDLASPEAQSRRRYLCHNPECGWEGLIDRRQYHRRQDGQFVHTGAATSALGAAAEAPAVIADGGWTRALWTRLFGHAGPSATRARLLLRAPATMFMAGFLAAALVAGTFTTVERQLHPPQQGRPLLGLVPAGETNDGDDLPPGHPLLATFEGPVGSAKGSPLTLKHRCAWGKPGGNPYKGTVEEALTAARLPPDVIKEVALRVKNRDVTDRLTITNSSIRGDKTGVEFDPRAIAMTYGRTLCLATRVNFKPGHQEPADLYTVTDGVGRRYSVMVPDVCGNVSVLSEAGKSMPTEVLSAGQTLADAEPRHTVNDLVEAGGKVRVMSVIIDGQTRSVPLPGSLALVGIALAAMAVTRRRR